MSNLYEFEAERPSLPTTENFADDLDDSTSISEIQLKANYSALTVLKNLVDALDQSNFKANPEFFEKLKQLRAQHVKEINAILRRKQSLYNM